MTNDQFGSTADSPPLLLLARPSTIRHPSPAIRHPSCVIRHPVSPQRGMLAMTYCLGIRTREGLVLASDSRSNAGYDQVNVCRKMHTFVMPGERVFVLLASGSLSCTQSV